MWPSVRTLFVKRLNHLAPFGTRCMARSNPWPTKDFKLGHHACGLQAWVRWIPLFNLQGRAKIFASLHAAACACAMCHQSTHGRHHRRRSGILARRMVPRWSRSDQPFGRYSRKCFNKHTYWLTDWLTNTVRPTIFHGPTEGNLRS